jgi:hypothetical protein
MGNQYHYLTLCALMRASAAPGAADFLFRPLTDSTAARAGGNWGISAVSLPLALPREMLKNQMQAISMRYLTL